MLQFPVVRWTRSVPAFFKAPPRRHAPRKRLMATSTVLENRAFELFDIGVNSPPALAGALGSADIAAVPRMRSSELRKLSQAAATTGAADARLWDAISRRCESSAEQLNYWDSVLILQSFANASVRHPDALMRLGEALCSKTSHLAPKMILDLFAVYELFELRPRALYVELFHALLRLSRSMYAEEVSLTFQALARYKLGNPTVIAHLMRAVQRQIGDFRLRYLCGVAGALGSLEACHEPLMEKLDKRAEFEVQTVAVQELLDNLQAFPTLEFSWRPYEELCLNEFTSRTRLFTTHQDVDQLVDPFETMAFLQARGLLHKEFLEAMCQWCLYGVHRPNVRSERRPTAKQLVMLHGRCREWDLDSTQALQDAIRYYVESGGGRWPKSDPAPLRFYRKRAYVRTPDPVAGLQLSDGIDHSSVFSQEVADPAGYTQSRHGEDLPGLPPSAEVEANALMASKPLQRGQAELKKSVGETVTCWITSRRSPRPRIRRDPGMKRILRKKWGRTPLWIQGGWQMRPKYQQGVATRRYPWAGVPVGKRGAAWVLRR